jgi:hypothetical protein
MHQGAIDISNLKNYSLTDIKKFSNLSLGDGFAG